MILSKIKSKTLQDLLKVLSGNIVSQGIGFLTTIFVSRDMGAEQYGIFSLLIAIFTIAVQISDFGISTSYVKYVSENLSKAREIFFTIVVSKIILSIIIMVCLYILSGYISQFFFETMKYQHIIMFIGVGVLFHSMLGVVISHYQATQHFKRLAYANIAHNTLRFLAIVVITLLFAESEHMEYFIYGYLYSAGVILLFIIIKNISTLSLNYTFELKHFQEIYKLGFWIFLSSFAVMIFLRLDIVMLQKLSSSSEVGYYSAAMNLAMIFPLITSSLTATLLPKMNNFLQTNSIKKYIFFILKKGIYVLPFLLFVELISSLLILLLFGKAYTGSIHVFQVLILSYGIGIIVNPISLVFYSIKRAYILTIQNWMQLFLNYFGNILLIPLYQAEGAAVSTLIVNVFGGLFTTYYLLNMKDVKDVG